jgi:hypothetical protein
MNTNAARLLDSVDIRYEHPHKPGVLKLSNMLG